MEVVDIYNNKREKLNITRERGKQLEGEYSISVHVWIVEKGRIWIQKRASERKIFPNMWEQAGGGVLSGETSIETVKRECMEELGIDVGDDEIIYIGSYTRKKDIVDVWMAKRNLSNDKILLQSEEVADIKFVTFEELYLMIKEKLTVPTIEPSYAMLKNYCESYEEK